MLVNKYTPRACGNEPGTDSRGKVTWVILPAHAGMSRATTYDGDYVTDTPRACGDKPQAWTELWDLLNVFPAHAGMSPCPGSHRLRTIGIPRVCGYGPPSTCNFII